MMKKLPMTVKASLSTYRTYAKPITLPRISIQNKPAIHIPSSRRR